MVLGRDIASRIQVSIEMKSTLPTDEYASRTAVGANNMPAAATHLRGMPGGYPSHHTTPFLGLVPDKPLELGKRPSVHPSLGFRAPFGLHPVADVLEVFQNNRRAGRGGLNDLLGEHMIAVAAEAPLPVAYTFQMPFCALCALLRERTFQVEQPTFDRLPYLLTQEAVVRCDGRTRQTKIDAYDLISQFDFWSGNRHDNVQPPAPIALDQISSVSRIARILGAVIRNMEADRLSPTDERQPHGAAL